MTSLLALIATTSILLVEYYSPMSFSSARLLPCSLPSSLVLRRQRNTTNKINFHNTNTDFSSSKRGGLQSQLRSRSHVAAFLSNDHALSWHTTTRTLSSSSSSPSTAIRTMDSHPYRNNRNTTPLFVAGSPLPITPTTQPPPLQTLPKPRQIKLPPVPPLPQKPLKINLLTIPLNELESLLQSWKHPKYRAKQILHWIHECGVSDIDDMANIPKKLRHDLKENATIGSLELEVELVSKDGTKKRAYRLWDGQLIESVLMPYDDGRNTACISSQAGCAMGCVFCATGQMGFARQLTTAEIFEQVARFASELKSQNRRLTNVVLMGMGEPLANYRNVMGALERVNAELGVGARRITVSTVGVVPSIKKLMGEGVLQVRLAVSLHCAEDGERTALLPANARYGGLDELMGTIHEYITVTKRRVTFEWALIEGENDTPEVARSIGRLLKRFGIRKDMIHVNLIPLNPTGGFKGGPSGKRRVDEFVRVLEREFGISATPRVRRGIDIEAGCGQLKAAVKKKEERKKRLEVESSGDGVEDEEKKAITERDLRSFFDPPTIVQIDSKLLEPPIGALVGDDTRISADNANLQRQLKTNSAASILPSSPKPIQIKQPNQSPTDVAEQFLIANDVVDLDNDFIDEDDEEDDTIFSPEEIDRLINLVKNTSLSQPPPPPRPIVDVNNVNNYNTNKKNSSLIQKNKSVNISTTPKPIATFEEDELESILAGPTTTITDKVSVRKSKGRKKKILKNLRAIDKLRGMETNGKILNQEQQEKIAKELEWQLELESIEHNLQ